MSLVAVVARDTIVCEGPDTIRFLHSQLSQDVAGLAVGDTRWSFLLQPQGKPVGLLRVTRLADDRVLLDTDPGAGEPVRAALERFKIRTKTTLTLSERVRTLAFRGGAEGAAAAAASDGAHAVPFAWGGWTGVDVVGTDAVVDGAVDADAYEAVRIEHGVPRCGHEVTDAVIPAETGAVPVAVSFTKGCYVGQELVERIDSRGSRVPRILRRVRAAAGVAVVGADLLADDGRVVGTVTSAAPDPTDPQGRVVALAFVRREVEPPAALSIAGGPATVEALAPAEG